MVRAATDPTDVRRRVAELLDVDPQTLDPDADLIAAGLDSIRMMSLSGRWRREGFDVDFAALAANPTITGWAQLLSAPGPVTPPAGDTHTADGEDAPFPLAPMQHAMWVGRNDNQELGGVAGHLYVEFDGARIDADRLRAAADALARRHPMLRVEFLPDGTQFISRRALPVTVDDLRGLGDADAAARLQHTREAKSHQLLTGEVLQLSLTLLPGGTTRLHVDLDMQAADAVSYRTLMDDLVRLYRGEELGELGYSYRRYRCEACVSDARADADRTWWAERIPELPDAPGLPTVPPAEAADPRRSTRRWHWLDPQTATALCASAQRHGITPAMAVAASFSGTLARWSTGPRFLLNVPMFARQPRHPDVDALVGDFTSSLLLDVDLHGATTALDRAHSVQQTLHTAAAHSGYTGLEVLRDLGRHRGKPSYAPVVFTSALGLGDLFSADVVTEFGEPVWIISQGPQVLLDAQVTEFNGGILVNWDVREDLFRPGVIDAMFDHHIAELHRLAGDPGAWEAADPPAVPADQQQRRAAINSVLAPRSGERLHDGFFRRAGEQPSAPAVYHAPDGVYHSRGQLTYRELAAQALAVAAALTELGVAPGDVVAVLGPKGVQQIPAVLGIHAAGAAYLPIGADQPVDRARRILDTAAVAAALVCGPAIEDLPVPAISVTDAFRRGARKPLPAPLPGDDTAVAYVLFTSGSTGEPKGVQVSHAAAMNTVEFINAHFDIGPDDRALALSTLDGDISVLDVFGMLTAGGGLVVLDEDDRRDPDTWARLIEEHRVTVLHWLTGWLEMLVALRSGRLSTVRAVPTGGDWVRTDMVRALRRQAPGVRVAGLGGATETAIHNTICEPGELLERWSAVPFGIPLPNNACRVVAADGADCPDWVPGELWVGGRGIADGYRGRPDLTAQRFVDHDGLTWYRTGDLVRYLPDGALEFVGRADHRVKISGYRVELGEVEAALNRIDGVHGAVAAVLPCTGGRAGVQLGALVAVDDDTLGEPQLAAAMAGFVPPHMIPDLVLTVAAMPYTVAGKTDRKTAEARLVDEARRREAAPLAGSRAPATPLEMALADITATLLGLERVGADDDFFGLGGDSVLATALIARIRDWLDTPTLMVADVFAAHTVAGLAALLTGREPGSDRLTQVAEIYLEVAGMDRNQAESLLEAEAR